MAQGYPYTYMSNAQAIGLMDGVDMVANTDALRGEDAQVIYNALFADYARGAKLVNTTHGTSVESYPTLAESVWGLERAAVGEWQKDNKDDESMELTTCKAHTWVIVDEVVDKDNTFVAVPIEDETTDIYTDGKKTDNGLYYTFKYEGAADLESLKGYQVELWGSGSHNEPELETVTNDEGEKVKVYSYDWDIRAIKTVKGQTAYDYNPSMADSKPDNGTIELDDTSLDLESVADNNREKVLDITDEDGTVLDSDKRVEEAVNHKDGNTYKLIDWDSDGDVDFITVNKAYYVQVESVTSKKVVVSYLQDKNWEDETSNTKTESWDLDDIVDGNEYKVPDDLKEGDILEVTSTKAYNKSEKEVVTTYTAEVVEAEAKELTKVSTKGGLQLYFDDEVIDLAEGTERADLIAPENPDSYADFEEEEIGTGFDLYLNRNGFIVYSEYSNGDSGKYAMVLDTADGRDTAPRSLGQVDLLWADNSIKNGVEVAADLKIYESDGKTLAKDGKHYAYTQDPESGVNAGRHFDEQQIVGNVYKVYTDADGVVTKMVEMMTPGDDNTYMGATYSYDSKLDRLTVEGTPNSSLEDAKAIFAVIGNDYIQWDSKTNQDNLESGLYVDPDDVMAVSIEDMPNINTRDADAADPDELDYNVNDEDTTGTWPGFLHGWFYGDEIETNADKQIVLSKNSNDEVSAAVMAVDSFNYFTKGNVTPALLTYVDVSGKGDERQVTVDLAMGGKFQTGVECVKGDDVDDIFDYADLSAVKDAIGNGKYVEVTTNADGKITDINFMDTADVDANGDTVLKGNFYTVTRKAVAQKSTKWFSTFADAYFANDSEMYTLNRVEDTKSWNIIDETEFYTIDGTPSIEGNKSYTNHKMSIVDGFEDELANYKNDELKSTKLNEDEVDYSVVVSSYVNNKHNDVDEYYVVDVVTKNHNATATDVDVEAVFAYDDTLEEVEAQNTVLVGSIADFKAGTTATTNITSVAGQTQDNVVIANQPYVAGDKEKKAVSGLTAQLNQNTTPATLTINSTRAVAAGTYAIDLRVNNAETVTVTFKVTAADAQNVASVKPNGDSFKLLSTDAFEVEIVDQAGDPIENLTAADFTFKVNGVQLTNQANRAEDYSVTYQGKGVYQIRDVRTGADLTDAKIEVTVAGKTLVVEDAAQAATTITVNNVTYVLGAGAPAAETITVDNNATVADVTIKSDETKAASIDSDKKLALGVDVLKTLAAGSYDVVLTANGVDKTVTVTVSPMAANNITASAYKAGENNTATLTLTLTSPIKGMDGVIADVTDAENWEIASCAAFSSGTAPAVTKAEVNAEGTQIILTLNIEGAGSAAADVLSFNESPSTSFTIGTIANMTIA